MKALLTIPMLAAIATTGIISFHLFYKANYGASELLTVASFLTMILWVNILTNSKKAVVRG